MLSLRSLRPPHVIFIYDFLPTTGASLTSREMNIDEKLFAVSARSVNANSYQCLMALLVFTVSTLSAQSPYHADKKVVVLNIAVDYWTWGKGLADRLEKMQTDRPFVDGAVFHIGVEERAPLLAFNTEKWTEQKLMFGELERIAKKSTRYKDNRAMHLTLVGFPRSVRLWKRILRRSLNFASGLRARSRVETTSPSCAGRMDLFAHDAKRPRCG